MSSLQVDGFLQDGGYVQGGNRPPVWRGQELPGVWAAVGASWQTEAAQTDLNERASQVRFLYIIFLTSWSLKATRVEFRSGAC